MAVQYQYGVIDIFGAIFCAIWRHIICCEIFRLCYLGLLDCLAVDVDNGVE